MIDLIEKLFRSRLHIPRYSSLALLFYVQCSFYHRLTLTLRCVDYESEISVTIYFVMLLWRCSIRFNAPHCVYIVHSLSLCDRLTVSYFYIMRTQAEKRRIWRGKVAE